MSKCLCCILKNLIDAIKGISVSCNVPQPLEVTGNITTSIDIPQPLEVTGTITADIPNSITVNGTINTVSTDACAEAMAKILGQSSSFNEIVFKNDEQFQNVENLTVDGSVVSFTSQNQKVQTTLCNIEFVVL